MKDRIFIPGSQWIYIKLYTGQKTADDLLIKILIPILRKIQRENLIYKWFFIRYADPDFHLRIRLLASDIQNIGGIIQLFYQKLYKWNSVQLLWKIQLDTYKRELERYGGRLIAEGESIFYRDSECVLSIVKKLNILSNENYRWMIALKLIDALLSDFSFRLEEKRSLMESVSNSYKVEFGFNEYNSKQLNDKFRKHRLIVESVLNNKHSDPSFLSLYAAIKRRSLYLKPIIESLHIKLSKNRQGIQLETLLPSYIHMMMNRLFYSKARVHELVLYDFMRRYYAGEIAKLKYSSNNG